MIETKRLSLAPIDAGDFEDLVRLTGHPEVGGRLKHGILDRVATRALLDDYLADWRERGFGPFVARTRGEAAFAGLVGLRTHQRTGGVALRYAIMPEHRGHGYTEEALPAILAFAARLGVPVVMATTEQANAASRRILEKLGFMLCDDTQNEDGHPIVVYSMTLGVDA
jgi:RimJ/RimL family protein N-acetyltransferase